LSPMVGPMFGRVIPPVLSTGILVWVYYMYIMFIY
jgi:hypothetical protein